MVYKVVKNFISELKYTSKAGFSQSKFIMFITNLGMIFTTLITDDVKLELK